MNIPAPCGLDGPDVHQIRASEHAVSTHTDRHFWKYLAAAGLAHGVLSGVFLSVTLPSPKLERPRPVEVVWVEVPQASIPESSPPAPPPPLPQTPKQRVPTGVTGERLEQVSASTAETGPSTSGEHLLGTRPRLDPEGKTLSHAQLFPDTLEGLGLEASSEPASGVAAGKGASGGSRTGGIPAGQGRPLDAAGITALIQADGLATQARLRADRSLHSTILRDYGSKLEDRWDVQLKEVQRWPIRPELKLAHPGPESMRDFKPEGWTGLDISDPCGYARYSLGQVRLVIDQTGRLLKRELVRTSGSRRLDREVLQLVDQSAPFEPPEPLDLGRDGLCRSIWDIGVRDYSRSSCYTPGQKPLVKDILLVALEP